MASSSSRPANSPAGEDQNRYIRHCSVESEDNYSKGIPMKKLRPCFCIVVLALVSCVPTLIAQINDGMVLAPNRNHNHVAAPKTAVSTLLVSCDVACSWSLDGKNQPDIAQNGSVSVSVTRTQHLLIVTSSDGIDSVHKLVNVTSAGQSVFYIELLPVRQYRLKLQGNQTGERSVSSTSSRNALVDIDTWTDQATGLMWTKKDSDKDVDWQDAMSYCQNLQLDGITGWRLPEIDELQRIYDPSIEDPGRWSDGHEVIWHVKGRLYLTGWHWSKTLHDGAREAWVFGFFSGYKGTFNAGNRKGRALCVRP